MKTFTLTELTELLDVDPKTLRRWLDLEEFDLEKQVSKYDKRIKWLSEDQVKQLAKAHERVWPPLPKPAQEQAQDKGIPGKVAILDERVERLEAGYPNFATLDSVHVLLERLEALEHKYTELFNKHTDVLLELHELRQAKKPGRKPKGEVTAQGED